MMTNKRTRLNIFILLIVVAIAGTAAGQTIYVDAGATGTSDGASWANAYNDLQGALAVGISGDEIWVAQGTYKPTAASDPIATFQLINGVGIYGGFSGSESNLNERDWQANETILSGDLLGDDGPDFANNSENSYHVVTGSGTDTTAVLDGFTITGGNANSHGGGMYNMSGSLTVTNCTFSGNSAVGGGGGMFNYNGSSPTVTNCSFSGNSASSGGGMSNMANSSSTVTNCTFSGNSATYHGGGLNNHNSSPTLTNCMFSGNSAGWSGGGMYNESEEDASSPTLTNCTFTGNSAGSDDLPGKGGGMDNVYVPPASSPTLTNCILWGNSASSGPEIFESVQGSDMISATVSYSDVQGGWSGTGNIGADPLFVDAVGPDGIVGTEDDNLRLSASSPCIDAGDNTTVPAGVTTDLDGNPRFVDDPTPDTGSGTAPIVDMGAYEANISLGQVVIDIKPGSYPNSINLGSYGLIPVAILSNAEFDATTVNPDTVELAGAGVAVRGKSNKYMAHQEDVNGDGLVDLLVQVATENLDPDSFQDGFAVLTGNLLEEFGGTLIEGADEITIVPPVE